MDVLGSILFWVQIFKIKILHETIVGNKIYLLYQVSNTGSCKHLVNI